MTDPHDTLRRKLASFPHAHSFDPDAIRALLAERDALKAERDALVRDAEDARSAWLGSRDFGHLPLAEAAERVIAPLVRDAERYRWLRQQHEGHEPLSLDADGLPMPLVPTELAFTVFQPERGSLEPVGCIPGELDAAIDTAMQEHPC